MSLFGLAPTTALLGAALLLAGLLALHLLRVRLRRVEVDTLLFFKMAGAIQKPRVLPGRPARWLALALAALAAGAAWFALAEPRGDLAAPSRFVVVAPDASCADARLTQARDLASQGLGPRGAVLAATSPPRLLLRADEPLALLAARADALREGNSALASEAALRAAARQLHAGDDLVWLAPEPAQIAGLDVRHVATPHAAAPRLHGLEWSPAGDGATLVVHGAELGALELRDGEVALANAPARAGVGSTRLGPCPPERTVRLLVPGCEALTLRVPAAAPLQVAIDADLGAELRSALDALLAVATEFTPAASPAAADVVVAKDDDPSDPRPRLVLTAGVGSGPRHARLGADAPLQLALRDGKRRSAPALPLDGKACTWIEDAAQGAPLCTASHAEGRRRVAMVDWLLLPVTRADVPELLGAALRALGARPATVLTVAGESLALPAPFGDDARLGAVALRAAAGAWSLQPATAGERTLASATGDRAVTTAALQRAAAVRPVDAAALQPRGGDGAVAPWLLALLVVLLVADALLFHRGRLP